MGWGVLRGWGKEGCFWFLVGSVSGLEKIERLLGLVRVSVDGMVRVWRGDLRCRWFEGLERGFRQNEMR